MKTFYVKVKEIVEIEYTVEAENADEAEDKFNDGIWLDQYVEDTSTEILDIEEA